ncbi:MAG: PHP domain-containing protein [Mariniblastus sp.]
MIQVLPLQIAKNERAIKPCRRQRSWVLGWSVIGVVCLNLFATSSWVSGQELATPKYWRGNLHTHSLWSDGNDFPEMICKWYSDTGYHFLALTDHNILSEGERWMNLATIEQRAGKEAMRKYLSAYGDDWVVQREVKSEKKPEPTKQVRLRGLDEFRDKFETKNGFLLIEAEEISDRAQGRPIHMNAMNLSSLISPLGGATPVEAINNNLRAAQEQAKKNGAPIMVHLNHPNFGWAVTAEELAAVTNERFFELYNGHPSVNHLGDATRPGTEKMWDIANTIRIDQLNSDPIFGLATDDSHHYHNQANRDATTGRGWIMVKANELDTSKLIESMNRGDFYSSSGVTLDLVEVATRSDEKQLRIKIKPVPGVKYTTQFIGTRKNYNKQATARLDSSGKPVRATKVYSDDVGIVLKTVEGENPSYTADGDELFVRAVITSDRPHPNPSFKNQKEQAWTQPVFW